MTKDVSVSEARAREIATEIQGLIDAYWNAAYDEGAEGRTTDTIGGRAGEIRSSITQRLDFLTRALRSNLKEQPVSGDAGEIVYRLRRVDSEAHRRLALDAAMMIEYLANRASPPSPVSRESVIERAANLAYEICARTRHVTLGDEVATAIRALSPTDKAEVGK